MDEMMRVKGLGGVVPRLFYFYFIFIFIFLRSCRDGNPESVVTHPLPIVLYPDVVASYLSGGTHSRLCGRNPARDIGTTFSGSAAGC